MGLFTNPNRTARRVSVGAKHSDNLAKVVNPSQGYPNASPLLTHAQRARVVAKSIDTTCHFDERPLRGEISRVAKRDFSQVQFEMTTERDFATALPNEQYAIAE